jgi:N-hydroxyarylamine O-acetyltransferase
MSFDLDAYIARIRLTAAPAADAEGLATLQHAHRLAIPFENLDVRLGRGIRIDGESVFAKLVTDRRGGYCFEQNRLFGDALAALGFTARPLLARVWLGASEVPPLTHTLSLVTIDGQDWIADAGFGASYSPPMPLADGAIAHAADGARFRLTADRDYGWTLLRDGDAALTDGRLTGSGFRPLYSFTLAKVPPADLALGNHWSSTAPGARFVTRSVVSIVLPRGFAGLVDCTYHCAAPTIADEVIDDPCDYRLRLATTFRIDLSAEDVMALGLF